ncbi:phenolic glucoside malonyltransferase 2-like [Zingiber officinale]|uniref:phenolic glucoside malonyltransferase 2-like n=1 Tax=Zingiber officinale TaxID=94328 RepID=UPI001C4D81C1|nr:phenolic glucoside malonyltransferase 2-like [Zingiber officinale]
MTSPPSELRVLEAARVGPPPGSVPESSLPFTFFDIAWLYGRPVQRVFFYRFPHSASHFMESVFPTLKSALSLTLRDFYPLAGKVRLAPGSQSQYELHYAEGDCVPFVVAEHDGDFDDLSGCHPRQYTGVRPLAPQIPEPTDDDQRPVMALQVTLFPNRGLALAVAVHHLSCDGSSSTRFLSSWARRASGLEKASPAPPSFDRSSIPDPNDAYSKLLGLAADARNDESMMVQFAHPDAVIGTMTLTADDLRKLKATISSKAKNASFRCSDIVATYAYAWVSCVKARAPSAESTVHLVFAGNCRGRLQPALPAEYFGNCIVTIFCEAKAGDLAGEDGVVVAARIVGEGIEQFKAEPLRDAGKWLEKYRAIAMQRPLAVAGSPEFKVYDVDFGWGRPVKVDMPSIAWIGTISVAESRDESGGVEIGLVATKTEMDQFVAHFSHGLKLLHKF